MNYSSTGKCIITTIIGIYIYFQIGPVITNAKQNTQTQLLMTSSNNTDMIPFYWMVAIVGGCIAITLTYVSWRKYKGEKKREQIEKDSE